MQFRPTLAASLTLAALGLAFVALSCWQWQRAGQKQALQDRFANPATLAALPVPALALTRVRLDGQYLEGRHILVDNRVLSGRAGVHVLTPFSTRGGEVLLVNRGWLPWPDRQVLPVVPETSGEITLSGHLDRVRQDGLTVGEPDRLQRDRWPQVVTYPDMGALGEALTLEPYPLVLYLAPGSPGALAGLDWNPFPMPAVRHRGYAVTWLAMALACVGTWLAISFDRGPGARA